MSVRRQVGSFFRSSSKFFKWLFKGKSLSSHIAFLLVAYFGLKFVLFPLFLELFGLVDVVAVISNSMHHQAGVINNTFTGWLVFNGYNQTEFNEWPFHYGLDMGDAVIVVNEEIVVGDVIVYYHTNDMIIHRVVNMTFINGVSYYDTKGDANPNSLSFEFMIPESQVIGKARFRVPLIGWPRTLLYYLIGF